MGISRAIVHRFVCEMIGTALLMMLGCMTFSRHEGEWQPSPMQVGMTFGMVMMIIVSAFEQVPGAHSNPALTLAALLSGCVSKTTAAVYALAQLAGALVGLELLVLITPDERMDDRFCCTRLFVPATNGLVIETLLTAALATFACSLWDPANRHHGSTVALKFGFAFAALTTTGLPYTGGNMNPVRTFAPALINNQWEAHWIYWVGPFLGSIVGALLYRFVLKKDILNTID